MSPSRSEAGEGPLDGRSIAVFGSSTLRDTDDGWAVAEALGRELAAAGAQVLNGGYGGAMEAVSRGAHAAGGRVTGVTLSLFTERVPNRFLTGHQPTETLLERLRLLLAADGFVTLEGSVGTLAEFFLAWNHALLERGSRPLVCLGSRWREWLRLLRDGGFVTDAGLFDWVEVAEDPAEAVRLLSERLAGTKKGAGG